MDHHHAYRQQSVTLHNQILARLRRIESFSTKNRHLLANHCTHLMLIYEEISELQGLLATRLHTMQLLPQADGPQEPSPASLTPRETKVLSLFSKGFSYRESASYLNCKLSTVQTHAKTIYKKLGVHSRAEAVHEALLLGLILP